MSDEDDVRSLGRRIGYGRVMTLAEQLWREDLAADGLAGGEFTVGPCASELVPHDCWYPGKCEVCCNTGRVTKRVAEMDGEVHGE